MVSKEKAFYNNILWFDKRVRYEDDFFEWFQPQRKVKDNPRYKSGLFYSEKCGRNIQYESGLELAFIKQLEQKKNVRFYYEQPVQVKYKRSKIRKDYTPDFGVFLDTNEFVLVEIKDLPGMLDNKVQMKIEGLIDFCSQRGFGLLLTDGTHTIDKINRAKNNKNLEKDILAVINNGIMRKAECTELMDKHNATQMELYKIVLHNKLKFRSYPFHLKDGNKNHLFYQVYVEKKRYDDIVLDRFRSSFF